MMEYPTSVRGLLKMTVIAFLMVLLCSHIAYLSFAFSYWMWPIGVVASFFVLITLFAAPYEWYTNVRLIRIIGKGACLRLTWEQVQNWCDLQGVVMTADLHAPVMEWCRECLSSEPVLIVAPLTQRLTGDGMVRLTLGSQDVALSLYFRSENDLLLFKMRWWDDMASA